MYLKELASVATISHVSNDGGESSRQQETSLVAQEESESTEDEAVGMTLWKRGEHFAMVSELSFDFSESILAEIEEDECSVPEAPRMERFHQEANRDSSPKIPHKQSSIASFQLTASENDEEDTAKDCTPRLSRQEETLAEADCYPRKESELRNSMNSCGTKITVLSSISDACISGPSPDQPPKMAVRVDSMDLCAILESSSSS